MERPMANNNAPQNFPNAGHFYSNIAKPIEIDLNFVVDSTNGNGLGIRSLKSNGYVQNVFLHTTATPMGGNPNPASGLAMIQLKGNFNKYLGGFSGFVSPVTGSALTSTTAGNAYVITALGTTTTAQWNAAGLPQGLTPTVGQAFIATATGPIGGTGSVHAPGVSGITSMEVIGDPNTEIANSNTSANGGAILIVQFLAPTSSSVTTPIPTAPANNSVVGMTIKLDGSSVTVDGL
jgi:hypothetical protein